MNPTYALIMKNEELGMKMEVCTTLTICSTFTLSQSKICALTKFVSRVMICNQR